jgi:hypothetical protein
MKCPLTATGDRLPIALDENGLDYFFTRGMLCGDVEKLHCLLQLIMAELMHQGSTASAGPE